MPAASPPGSGSAGSTAASSSSRAPRLHVAFPVFRALPIAAAASGSSLSLSLDRGFFDQHRIANPLAATHAHARLQAAADGEVFLVEEGGSSGTFVNGLRLEPNERVALTEGTVLRIGTTVLVYREGDRLAAQPTKDALATLTARGVRHTFVGPFSLPAITREVARLGRLAAAEDAETRPLVFLAGSSRSAVSAIADWLHENARTGRPFVAVATEGLTETAAEALLVGAAEGTVDERAGLFALGAGGTVFLDEIAHLPLRAQALLLRFLEHGSYQRPGGEQPHRADVLILAGSAVGDEATLLARGVLPALAARLAERRVRVPALADRREDIGAIVLHLLSQRAGQASVDIDAAAIEALLVHDWPGDLPELHAALDRALGSTRRLVKSALPGAVLGTQARPSDTRPRAALTEERGST
jgi:transcriptional regulator of acetoin/glycerol metabolism